jgi:hypothetical protein
MILKAHRVDLQKETKEVHSRPTNVFKSHRFIVPLISCKFNLKNKYTETHLYFKTLYVLKSLSPVYGAIFVQAVTESELNIEILRTCEL